LLALGDRLQLSAAGAQQLISRSCMQQRLQSALR
jgi:hypothetical protein